MTKPLILIPMLAAALAAPALGDTIVATGRPIPEAVIAVSFADLDLTKPAGLAVLDSRVRSASRKVCGIRYDSIALDEFVAGRACYNESLARARHDIALAAARLRNGAVLASLAPIAVSRR